MSRMLFQAESAAVKLSISLGELFSSGFAIILLIMIVGAILCVGVAGFASRWQEKRLYEEYEENNDESDEQA